MLKNVLVLKTPNLAAENSFCTGVDLQKVYRTNCGTLPSGAAAFDV